MPETSDDARARPGGTTRARERAPLGDANVEFEAFGGEDVLRASRATPLTPPMGLKSRAEEWSGHRCTLRTLEASEKAKLAGVIERCAEATRRAGRFESELETLRREMLTERSMREAMERERDEAVARARALGEEAAAARERCAELAATCARLRERVAQSRSRREAEWTCEGEEEAPKPRGTLALEPVTGAARRKEYGEELMRLVRDVEQLTP